MPAPMSVAPTRIRGTEMRPPNTASTGLPGMREASADHRSRSASSPRVQMTADPTPPMTIGQTSPSPSQKPALRSRSSTPSTIMPSATPWRRLGSRATVAASAPASVSDDTAHARR